MGEQTSASPNSWATVSLWRRYFKWKEEQEILQIEALNEVLQESEAGRTPSRTEYTRKTEFSQFKRETDHHVPRETAFANSHVPARDQMRVEQQQDTRVIDSPNLDINSMRLAQ